MAGTIETADPAADGAPAGPLRRHVAAAVAGNWLEFYDFTVYLYFSNQIGDAFFSGKHSAFVTQLLSLMTFGLGFISRPIGAIFIGRYADRVGRTPAMLLSFSLMGLSLLGLVCVPTQRQIGWVAPTLVLLLRLVQGFALGGEVGPTTAYLIESAGPNQRGLFGAWQSASQSLASISGGLAGLLLATVLGAVGLHDWGWRIAMLAGLVVLPFGFVIRRNLPETRHRPEARLPGQAELANGVSDWTIIRSQWRLITLGLGLIAGGTISTYISIYMTTYAQTTLHWDLRVAFLIPVTTGVAGFVSSLAGGFFSDRFGRRALMIWPRLIYLVVIMPVFMVVVKVRDPTLLLALMAGLSIISNLGLVPALVALTESLRKEVRSVATATIYATAVAVFGGTTPLAVAWLVEVTHNPLAIAWYLMGATVVALVAASLMVETAGPRAKAWI